MKKYVNPSVLIFEIENEEMVAASPTNSIGDGGDVKPGSGNGDIPGSPEANGYRSNLWD